jgi:hypothetical protein
MANEELKNFIEDLALIIEEKYNQSLEAIRQGNSEGDIAFQQGANFAYYDALTLIRLQLIAFGYEPEDYNFKVPELGEGL